MELSLNGIDHPSLLFTEGHVSTSKTLKIPQEISITIIQDLYIILLSFIWWKLDIHFIDRFLISYKS